MADAEYYSKRIKECRVMYDLCLHYLKFAHGEERKKDRLRGFKIEVAEKNNFNRIKSAERLVKDATYNDYELWNARKVLAKILGVDEYSDEVRQYKTYLSDMETMGPKKYLVECLEKIEFLKQCAKDAQEREKREQERKRQEEREETLARIAARENSSSTYGASHISSEYPTYVSKKDDYTGSKTSSLEGKATTRIDKKKPKTVEKKVDEIISKSEIKNRVKEGDYIEDSDIEAIEKQYELGNLKHSYGFLSRRTIEGLIAINDARVGLSNKYSNMIAFRIATAFNNIYKLAIEELKDGDNYDDATRKMRRVMRDFGGTDFVEIYTDMYDKLYEYMYKLPKNAREEFQEDFYKSLAVSLTNGPKSIMPPETFRMKLNQEIKPEIIKEVTSVAKEYRYQYLVHKTKYMTAADIAHLYHEYYEYKNRYSGYDCSSFKELCVELIESRMPKLDEKDPNYRKEREERIEAIKKDYFYENNDAKEGSARKIVEQKETITAKKKEYFRMSKFKQAIELMNYKKLLSLEKKSSLTESEIATIRGMF